MDFAKFLTSPGIAKAFGWQPESAKVWRAGGQRLHAGPGHAESAKCSQRWGTVPTGHGWRAGGVSFARPFLLQTLRPLIAQPALFKQLAHRLMHVNPLDSIGQERRDAQHLDGG